MPNLEATCGNTEIKGIHVMLHGPLANAMDPKEITEYIDRGLQKFGSQMIGIALKIPEDDPEMIDIQYETRKMPFSRLRRITGYLVGDMNKWNNAKRSEEHDRVKHDVL